MLPFDLLPYEESGRVPSALKGHVSRNAWVELHNLIVAAESRFDYGPAHTRRIGREHGVDFRDAFLGDRLGLYATYLDYCIDNTGLTDTNRAELAHLARSLLLAPYELQPVHERAFGRTVSNVLSDDCVTMEERLLLYKLQHVLGVDPVEADIEYEDAARRKLLVSIAHALCDGMLSPDEEQEILLKQKEFGVSIPQEVNNLLTEAKHAWMLVHAEMPSVKTNILLKEGEMAHIVVTGVWNALNYAQLRVHLSDYRDEISSGQTAALTIPQAALPGRERPGTFILTNMRFVIQRPKKTSYTYSLRQIDAVESYANGLRLGIDGGRSLYVHTERKNDLLLATFRRLID